MNLRIAADTDVLKRAGVELTEKTIVLQYFPPELESRLARLEEKAAGGRLKKVKSTLFGIRGGSGGYEFYVANQTFN